MRALDLYRREFRRRVARQMAVPETPRLTTSQHVTGAHDLLELPAERMEAIQNADGTFPFMAGYDALGSGPLA